LVKPHSKCKGAQLVEDEKSVRARMSLFLLNDYLDMTVTPSIKAEILQLVEACLTEYIELTSNHIQEIMTKEIVNWKL
jgi:hypothetical protein